MNQLLSFLLLSSFAFGQEFYSMITPIKTFTVKSAVGGEVVFVNKKSEKSYLKNSTVIKLDDSLDVVNLEQTKIKLANQKEIYAIENGILDSYNKVSSKTKIDKDAQKIKVLNIASNIADMEMQIANLQNNIKKKNLKVSNIYLSSIEVEVGDFVNAGGLLYKAYDLSSGKLELFLPINEIETLKKKTIYLNGIKTNLKISKISKVADEKNISSYKVEILIKNPKTFSKLVKVEFK
ncbi:MAG: HlyD family efflux transporter periplasmic adaptor subunit [Arcobacteraceae bacterium]|jgi:hypothetical protein|nr:HlyD family efflux transporter periplasmic adaptor subunit [Arcobacteraceae bacterium]